MRTDVVFSASHAARRGVVVLSAACVALAAAPLLAAAQRSMPQRAAESRDAAALLTPADVAKITGLGGIHLVPRGSAAGAGGDLNFAQQDGTLVLMVNIGTAEQYRHARAQKEITVGGKSYPMPLFNADVPGIGDEAFNAPPGGPLTALYVRKGDRGLSFTTYYAGTGPDMKPILTQAELGQLARLAISRM
ncbi:MAG TPA: hypothetical protein VFW98_15860 [Gemmatimonadaceae bacterium]|nr:hypothetical protein [Gemmatimonadaceae bacterium]